MKTALLGMLTLVGLAASASAEVIHAAGLESSVGLATVNGLVAQDTGGLRAVVTAYDNWTAPPTALTGLYNSGGNEIADDLHMTAGGLLDTMGLNVANVNGTANLTGGQIAVRFYDFNTATFIGGFNANLPLLALAAGGSSRIQFGPGALAAFNFILPQDIYCSLQIVSLTWSAAGPTIANGGIQTRGPIAIGTSTDNMINVTGGGLGFNFGGNPLANTGLYIKLDSAIPAPGAMALLGLGGLLAARRRR